MSEMFPIDKVHGRSTRAPATGRRGMIASAHPLASHAGVNVLRKGGNAVDAAVAVASTLNVVEPYMSGMGGVGVGLVYMKSEGRTRALDFSGRAASSAQPELFDLVSRDRGPRAPLVPGNLSGWLTMHSAYGTLPLDQLFREAIDYATNGYPITPMNADTIKALFVRFADVGWSSDALDCAGEEPPVGSMLRQPALAESMAEVVAGGQETFYRGKLGDRICEGLAAAGGLISREDLASYKATWTEPITTTYRGLELRVPPPNSAGFQILETLNILDGYSPLEYGTPETIHLLMEAVLAASDDRVRYAGDPDRVDVPFERLISREYAEQVRSRIALDRASDPPAERFERSQLDQIAEYATYERVPLPGLTTHFATADSEGNVVTVTQTLGGGFGSGVAPGGTGVFLNNMGKWFDIDPGCDSPNLIAPGKRVDFCVSPVQVFSDDDIVLSIGTPGSYGILHTSVQMIHAFVDAGMNVQEAIEAPRFRHYDTGEIFYEDRVPRETLARLTQMGHRVGWLPEWTAAVGGGHGIQFTEFGTLLGGADPRRDGVAAGW